MTSCEEYVEHVQHLVCFHVLNKKGCLHLQLLHLHVILMQWQAFMQEQVVDWQCWQQHSWHCTDIIIKRCVYHYTGK